tara:strand:- start:373 stop:570 length:198 start_codon:yes stop_codon:yes gene_type:complete
MDKLEATISELMKEDGKSEEEIFEMVNKILIKSRKGKLRGKKHTGKKRKPVCRPVLLISDSSCDE